MHITSGHCASCVRVCHLALVIIMTAQVTDVLRAEGQAPFSRVLRSDWRFAKDDHQGAEAPGFDDSQWMKVRVPHDWAIAGPFNPSENGYAGKLPWRGVGWYRRSFMLDCAQLTASIWTSTASWHSQRFT